MVGEALPDLPSDIWLKLQESDEPNPLLAQQIGTWFLYAGQLLRGRVAGETLPDLPSDIWLTIQESDEPNPLLAQQIGTWFLRANEILRSGTTPVGGGLVRSATAPENPVVDQVWFDTTDGQLKLFNGAVWLPYKLQRLIFVTDPSISVIEGRMGTFGVQLSEAPTGGNTTIAVSEPGSGITVTPDRLVFTPDNFNVDQEVTVRAASFVAEADRSANIRLTPSGGGYDGITPVNVRVDVIDDPGRVSVTWNAGAGSDFRGSRFYTVRSPNLPADWFTDNAAHTVNIIRLYSDGRIYLDLSGDFTDLVRSDFVLTMIQGVNSAVVTGVVGDDDEPYTWTPANAAAVAAFYAAAVPNPVTFRISYAAP